MLRSSLRIYRTIQDRLSAGYCAHLPAGREGCQLRLSRAEAVPCRVGVATRNCCKMRCQTSHLTMQTGKWAACDFVYLFACDLHRATLFNCPPPPPTSSTVRTLSICLFVGLFVPLFAWLSVKTDGLKAQGCCRSRRCTCASSSRTLLPLLFVLVKQRRQSRWWGEGGRLGQGVNTTQRKTQAAAAAAKNNSILSEK